MHQNLDLLNPRARWYLPRVIMAAMVVFMSWSSQRGLAAEQHHQFDVVIAGGSTAGFAAAVSAAQEGARVALLEPTDWVGGQITASGVPAIDEAWHKLTDEAGNQLMDVARIARMPQNISPLLRNMLSQTGCPGNCWVSRFCFLPKSFLQEHLEPLEQRLPRLVVFRNTVVKQIETHSSRIISLTAIQRTPRPDVTHAGYDRLPSKDVSDWYARDDSSRFTKTVHQFDADQGTVFMDATEWGEILALSRAPYLQGVEDVDGGLTGDDTLGQAITFDFVQELHAAPDPGRDADVPSGTPRQLGLGDYGDKPHGWKLVWTYRRLASAGREVSSGDLSLQNWGYYPNKSETGNDYPFGYLFLGRAEAAGQREDWRGGVDLGVMAAAEQHAFAWHHYFKSIAPRDIDSDRISLARNVLGTGHGLAKLPYIRDTRRSIGLDGFLLKVRDLQPTAPGVLAKPFHDRMALGAYPVDIHPLADRKYPAYIHAEYEVAPFTIPFRALTNQRFTNLLVAGKTMAQSFLANSATRLHPIEWSTGTAAGVIAAVMQRDGKDTVEAYRNIKAIQRTVAKYTPIDWTLPSGSGDGPARKLNH